jgi:hypothetical protein
MLSQGVSRYIGQSSDAAILALPPLNAQTCYRFAKTLCSGKSLTCICVAVSWILAAAVSAPFTVNTPLFG